MHLKVVKFLGSGKEAATNGVNGPQRNIYPLVHLGKYREL